MTTATPCELGFKEILIASDLSDASENATNFAKAIARRYGSHILLAHVSKAVVPVAIPEGEWFEDNSAALIEKQLEEVRLALREEGFSADTVDRYGPIKHEIEALAKLHHADLIVLGTHSRRGFERLLFGSEAESVLRSLTCPVLTVGPQAGIAPEGVWAPKHILCAIWLPLHSVGIAALAYNLAHTTGASLTLLSVDGEHPDPTQIFWDRLDRDWAALFPDARIKKQQIRHFDGAKHSGKDIADIAWQLKADLIVMGATPSGVLSSHLKRGIVPEVLAEAPCPVMTLISRS